MTDKPSFDQKNQSVNTQTNIIYQPSGSAPALPLPQQIPSPPLDFKGREEEIKSLLDQFDLGATITGLRGLGGIGKTALALVLADRLKDRFPGGQIFLNMQGTSKISLKPEDAMAQVIRAYNPVDRMPENQGELRGLYLSILSGKHALLLLDNAASREQVEPLLPPAGSAVLITSRNKFALPGLKEKDLDVLSLEDAKKLLLEVSLRIGDHAEELAKLCGCLPLALRNAAYVLKEMPNIGVADYVKRLGDARKRLELVEASFSASYDLLTPELQRLWSLLSVFPADFDLAGAAAVWGMEQIPAEDALGELVKWSLVDFLASATGEGGRYRLHDLARDFGSSRLENTARESARLRHARHYQELLRMAEGLFLKGKEYLSMGLKLFDINWMNIKAGQKWASENKSQSNEIAEICSNYSESWDILNLRLHPHTYFGWLEEALFVARQNKNKRAEAVHLSNLGNAYSDLGDPHKAIEHYKQALNIAREIGDQRGEEACLGNLGICYYFLGEPYKAIEHYKQALNIAHEIGDRRGGGFCLGNLGLAYTHLGDFLKAIEHHKQDLNIAREIGDQRGEGTCLGNLGNAYHGLGDTSQGIEYYELALNIAREIGDRRMEGNQLGNLGNAYHDLGESRQAIKYYKRTLNIAREIGDRRGESASLGNLGNAYDRLGELRRTIKCYELALNIAREIGDRCGEANHLFNMGLSLSKLGQEEKAVDLAKMALEIYEQIESRHAETLRQGLAKLKS